MFKGVGIDIVFTYPKTLRNTLGRHNADNGAFDISPGIYTIPCKDCPKIYLGETGRTFEKKSNEHSRDVRYARESNACFIHLREEGHHENWKDAKLIYKSSNQFERKMPEALLIRKLPNFHVSAAQWGWMILPHRYLVMPSQESLTLQILSKYLLDIVTRYRLMLTQTREERQGRRRSFFPRRVGGFGQRLV